MGPKFKQIQTDGGVWLSPSLWLRPLMFQRSGAKMIASLLVSFGAVAVREIKLPNTHPFFAKYRVRP